MRTRRYLLSPLTVTLAVAVCLAPYAVGLARDSQSTTRLPARLTDREFWKLVVELSEPGGYFQSDNLVSNERPFQNVVPALKQFPSGGVYLGVAPGTEFHLHRRARAAHRVHPRYSPGQSRRAPDVQGAARAVAGSRRFSVAAVFPPPAGGPLEDLDGHGALRGVLDPDAEPDAALFKDNLRAIVEQLTKVHGFDVGSEDLLQLESVFGMFFQYGPGLTYASSQGRGGRNMPTYADLQVAMDLDGQQRAFLASEEHYSVLRAMEQKNLIVPVVGDFAGPKALQAIGRYVAEQGATVTAYYTSNVEQYLFQNGVWQAFYANVATLPVDERSVFIRSARGQNVLDPIQLLLKDVAEGRIQTYASITSRGSVR